VSSVASGASDLEYRRAVGKRIRVWRVVNERSQDELAAEAGVTRNFVSAIERGAQGLDAVRLRRLAAVMGMTLGELLADPEPAGGRPEPRRRAQAREALAARSSSNAARAYGARPSSASRSPSDHLL
jgi:transcriptional regulator with XRE-family HTH domain